MAMCIVVVMADVLHQKDRKPNQQRKKVPGTKSEGKETQAFQIFSQRSHTGDA